MSTSLSSVSTHFKFSHGNKDTMGTFDDADDKNKSYIPLKPYHSNYATPTLGDILRGADTITSITINPSALKKYSDSERAQQRKLVNESPISVQGLPTYQTLLTSSNNSRPKSDQLKSAGTCSLKSKTPVDEKAESPTETMKLKGNKSKSKNNESTIRKGRRSRNRKRCKSAASKSSRGQSVVDRLYQVPTSNGSKSPAAKQESNVFSRNLIQTNGQGLGAMNITLCKPVTIHNDKPIKRDIKSEDIRRPSDRVCTASTSKSQNQIKPVELTNKDVVSLPQMTNNSLVNTYTAAQIDRKPNIFFSPVTHKVQVHTAGLVRHQDSSNKVVKVFLSDKHSGTVKECGIDVPCAPPATPTPDQLRKVEYVPSLNDIRSQRAVKMKLQVLEREAQKKQEKQQLERERQEKQNKKLLEKDLKQQQRQEIYALNKVMTELENSRFRDFCAKKGIKVS